MKIADFDPILHQPIRTKIIVYLANAGESDFTTLKTALNLSDGHMTTHMKQLIASQYVEARKAFVNNKPRTTYVLTKLGKQQLLAYLDTMKQIIKSSV